MTIREAIRQFGGSLQTKRLRLRPMELQDAEGLFSQFNDFEVVRWLAQPDWPQHYPYFLQSIERIVDEKNTGEAVHFTVLLNDQPIGGIAIINCDDLPVIGYWLGRRYWNEGYMTEAVGAVCDWIFTSTTAEALHSGVFVGNDASLRVQTKLGFQISGRSHVTSNPLGRACAHIDTRLDLGSNRRLALTI